MKTRGKRIICCGQKEIARHLIEQEGKKKKEKARRGGEFATATSGKFWRMRRALEAGGGTAIRGWGDGRPRRGD